MAKRIESGKMKKLHREALQDFDRIQTALYDERKQSLQDRRFYSIAGAQWEGALGERFENKPKFEVNKIHLSLMRIFSEYRNNRITVDYVSKDGSTDDELADICDGLFRADEMDSVAEEAYDNAFEEAVGGGYGALRLRAEYEDYEDDENEKQRIRIVPIFDADSSVYFDLDAKRFDKADANYCFVIYSMTHDAFKEEYDCEASSVQKVVDQVEYDWYTPDVVYVAEYYKVEYVKSTVHIFETLTGDEERYTEDELNESPELELELSAAGTREVDTKETKKKKIHKYILSGNSILKDCGYIAGDCIPVIPAYGKRWFVDNIERCMGHVRLAKDMQRLKNMQTSKLAEISALSSVEKPIMHPEQTAGLNYFWENDNIKNFPYLPINQLEDKEGNPIPAGPIGYTRVPNIPPAMAALLQTTDADIGDMLGNQDQVEKIVPNISGKAIEQITSRMDMQTFIYMSNFAKTVKRVGEVWLSMAKDIYVEPGRKMKMIGPMEQIESVELMQPIIDDSGALSTQNDITKATFDVAVDVGPSSTSRREATVRSLTNMLAVTNDPQTAQVLQAMIIMNMEGEGISEVKEYMRKRLVSMGVLKPTDEEIELMKQQSQPSPQDEALLSMAEEAKANAALQRSKTIDTLASAEKKKAETQKINAQTQEIASDIIKSIVTPGQ